MKKIIFCVFTFILLVILFESFAPLKIMRRDGTDPGYTGSPGDTLKNCTVCHGGVATTKAGWITSNIPASGYVSGQTYQIKAKNSVMGGTRFGFEVSPQALNGNLLGTMVITDTARTKLVGNDKYVTYKSAGVDGVDSNIWTFNWIAPAKGTGQVVFYGAFNANPGHKGSDGTTLSTLTVNESTANGLYQIPKKVLNFSVFPNPSNDIVNIQFEMKGTEKVILDIADLTGKQIAVIINKKASGEITKQFNTSDLPNGIYLVRLQVNGKTATQRLSIVH